MASSLLRLLERCEKDLQPMSKSDLEDQVLRGYRFKCALACWLLKGHESLSLFFLVFAARGVGKEN